MMTSELRPGCIEILGAVNAPASAGEQDAEGKGHRVDAVDAHAHADAHLLVVDYGQHDLAGDGAVEPEPDGEADGGGDRISTKS